MSKSVFHAARLSIVFVALLSLTGCESLGRTESNVLAGGAGGAVVGTLATVATGGCIPCGAAIGGAVGSGGGFVYSRMSRQPGR